MVFADGAKHSEAAPGAAFFCDPLGAPVLALGVATLQAVDQCSIV